MMKKLNLFILFVLILISLPVVYAHLDGGTDKAVGDYLIDFGFSPKNPRTTDHVTLAFNLLNRTTKKVIEPASVWIRISSSENVVFAGTFHPEVEHVAFSYTFPKAGKYEILARFKDEGSTLTETTFQLAVKDSIPARFSGSKKLFYILVSYFLAVFLPHVAS